MREWIKPFSEKVQPWLNTSKLLWGSKNFFLCYADLVHQSKLNIHGENALKILSKTTELISIFWSCGKGSVHTFVFCVNCFFPCTALQIIVYSILWRKPLTCRKCHWQTLSHNVELSTPGHERDSNSQLKWW